MYVSLQSGICSSGFPRDTVLKSIVICDGVITQVSGQLRVIIEGHTFLMVLEGMP